MKIYLTGGIGNQLFQIAKGLESSLSENCEPTYSDRFLGENWNILTDYRIRNKLQTIHEPDQFKGLIEPFVYRNLHPTIRSDTGKPIFDFLKLKRKPDLYGHFQNYQLVNRNQSAFLSLFSEFQERLKQKTSSIALHIRGGDYLNSNVYVKLSPSYYCAALAAIAESQKLSNCTIFTNDEPFAKGIAKDIYALSRFSLHINFKKISQNPLDDLIEMSTYRHIVLANSTYSWWSGFFGSLNGSSVYYPLVFFNSKTFPTELFPPRWISCEA